MLRSLLLAPVAALTLLVAGCWTAIPPGYDVDLTPDHDGAGWIGGASLAATADVRETAEVRSAMAHHRTVEPFCAWCGGATNLNVHHVWPVAMRPDLASADQNLITLCRDCHWVLGHCRNWHRAVINVRDLCDRQLVAGSEDAPR